jgi:hypothetical protein
MVFKGKQVRQLVHKGNQKSIPVEISIYRNPVIFTIVGFAVVAQLGLPLAGYHKMNLVMQNRGHHKVKATLGHIRFKGFKRFLF